MGVPLRVPFRDTIRVILEGFRVLSMTVWFLVGNGGMDYGDHYWGLCRDYYRDPFPHSLLSTRQTTRLVIDFRGRLDSGLGLRV